MQTHLVMTIIGEDKPGLVESVAAVITAHEGNWLESRMSRLGGKFAGILRVQIPAENETLFTEAVAEHRTQGLSIHVHPDTDDSVMSEVETVRLEVVGQDRPGIVSQISKVLASNGVNVEELQTERLSAPMSGELLFSATAKLQLPASCTVDTLHTALEQIAGDLMVDVTLGDV